MSRTGSRTIAWKSTCVWVEISPRTRTRPVCVAVSQATRASGSSRMIASRIASDTWSHILSGWPSVTDSEVNRYCTASTMLIRAKGSTPSLAAPDRLQIELQLDPAQRLVVDHAVIAHLDDDLALGLPHRCPDRAVVERFTLRLVDRDIARRDVRHLVFELIHDLIQQRQVVRILVTQLLDARETGIDRREARVRLLGLHPIAGRG